MDNGRRGVLRPHTGLITSIIIIIIIFTVIDHHTCYNRHYTDAV